MMLAKVQAWAAEVRKFLVAAAAALSTALSLDLLHGTAQHYAVIASAVIGAILVHRVPNAKASR